VTCVSWPNFFVVEEAPMLWSHIVLQAARPWKWNSERHWKTQRWSNCY